MISAVAPVLPLALHPFYRWHYIGLAGHMGLDIPFLRQVQLHALSANVEWVIGVPYIIILLSYCIIITMELSLLDRVASFTCSVLVVYCFNVVNLQRDDGCSIIRWLGSGPSLKIIDRAGVAIL